MSEKTREVPQLANATYTHTLVIKSTHGPCDTHYVTPMDLVFMSNFDDQSMSIGCVSSLGHLFCFLRHYLLHSKQNLSHTWSNKWSELVAVGQKLFLDKITQVTNTKGKLLFT